MGSLLGRDACSYGKSYFEEPFTNIAGSKYYVGGQLAGSDRKCSQSNNFHRSFPKLGQLISKQCEQLIVALQVQMQAGVWLVFVCLWMMGEDAFVQQVNLVRKHHESYGVASSQSAALAEANRSRISAEAGVQHVFNRHWRTHKLVDARSAIVLRIVHWGVDQAAMQMRGKFGTLSVFTWRDVSISMHGCASSSCEGRAKNKQELCYFCPTT
eukprot:1317342-Amphidinium_carterae.1